MTLQDRIARAEGRVCRTDGCERAAQRDALYCPDHLTAYWQNRPQWVQRRDAGTLPAKDTTGRAA